MRLNGVAQRCHEVVTVDRLLDKVVGSPAEGLNRQRVLAVAGDHQDGCVGTAPTNLGQEGDTIHSWHLDVGDDRVVIAGGDPVERGRRRVGGVHRHSGHSDAESLRKRLQQGRIVIDDEDAQRSHGGEIFCVSGDARGRRMTNVAPTPDGLTTEIVPPCSLMIP